MSRTETFAVAVVDPPSGRSWCLPHRQTGRPGCCLRTNTLVDRPDLAIYSQQERFALGQPPTWNNPDIVAHNFSPFVLRREALIKVRNLSAIATAVGVQVEVSLSRFGIGYPRTHIGGVTATLAPQAEQQLTVPFPQSVLAAIQFTAVYVALQHPADENLNNSAGAHAIFVFDTSEVGRDFAFDIPMRNPLPITQLITVQLINGGPDLMPSFGNWTTPFGPFEERFVSGQISVHPLIVGGGGAVHEREATFVGRGQDGSLIDGVTLVVRVDS